MLNWRILNFILVKSCCNRYNWLRRSYELSPAPYSSLCSNTQLMVINEQKLSKRKQKEMENKLRNVIIETHRSLRKHIQEKGDNSAEQIWQTYVKDEEVLKKYSTAIYTLASNKWEAKNQNSRISLVHKLIHDYFDGGMQFRVDKEMRKITYYPEYQDEFDISKEHLVFSKAGSTYSFLDVGSCYNPFAIYKDLDVTAIDIYPLVPEVKKCDFLTLRINHGEKPVSNYKRKLESLDQLDMKRTKKEETAPVLDQDRNATQEANCIEELDSQSFDVVTFCFFLSFIPSPRLRFLCCKKAYELLKTNGILVIVEPGNKHSSAISHLARLWKVTLAHLGFERVLHQTHGNFNSIVFRKGISRNIWKVDAEKLLQEMKGKHQNVKLYTRFQNFNYDSVPEMFYIIQDVPKDETNGK